MMNVWLIRVFRTILPLVLLLAGLISLSLILFAGLKRNPYLDRNYMFKVDASHFKVQEVPNKMAHNTSVESIGLMNNYYVYLWNHCESKHGLKHLYCSEPRFDYYFDSVRLLKARLKKGVLVKIPANSSQYHKRLRVTTYVGLIALVLGLLLSVATLVFVVIITVSGSNAVFTSVLSGFSLFAYILGSGFLVGQYYQLADLIKKKANYLQVKPRLGTYGPFYLWLTCGITFTAFISLLLATRFFYNKREAAKLYH